MSQGESLEPSGYVELLRENAPYRRLFSARVVSLFGDWFNMLAVLALLRDLGDERALAFAWILVLKTLPALFVAPLAGVLVDRYSRKAILISMDLLRAATVVALLCLQFLPSLPALYALILLQTCARAIAEPALNAVIPDLVAKRDLITANALSSAAWSAMFTLGTALGGLATHYLGWKVALGIDLGSFLLSALIVSTVPIPSQHGPGETASSAGSTSYRRGLAYLFSRPRIWTLSLVKAGWCVAGGITLVLTVLGERVHSIDGRPILGVTVLYMSRAIGTGLGPVISRWICGNSIVKSERIIGWAFLWSACLWVLVGQVPSLWQASLLIVLAHLGGATVWVFSTARLQALVPTELRGRVFATEHGLAMLLMSTSTLAFGNAIDAQIAKLSSITSALGFALLVPAILWQVREWVLKNSSYDPR